MNNFLIKLFTVSFPLLLTICSVNYIVDPANIFDENYLSKIVEILKRGENVSNIVNYDQRLLQKEVIKSGFFNPSTVVFGSSRGKLIDSENTKENDLFNSSVTSGGLKDIIAVYQMYKSENRLPKKIYLSMDPWMFNQQEKEEWKSIGEYYYDFKNIQGEMNAIKTNHYSSIISLTYFQTAIKALPKFLNGSNEPLGTNEVYNDGYTILRDGSLVYPSFISETSSRDKEVKILEYVKNRKKRSYKLSDELWSDFELLVKSINDENIDLTLILSPYHPLAFKELESFLPDEKVVEERLKEMSLSNKYRILGSFNPVLLNFNDSLFIDAIHCNRKGIEKILNFEKDTNEY